MVSAVDKQPAARLAAVAAAGCLPTAANESQSSCTTCGDTTQDDAHDEDTVMALARPNRWSWNGELWPPEIPLDPSRW